MRPLWLLLVLIAVAAHAAESAYPNRPVRLLVPQPPGGSTDTMARMVGQKLTELWGQPVVVDNRAGASGNIGTALVARSTADGYTILVNSSVFAVNPSLYKNAGYDPVKDFAPIIVAGISPNIVFVHPSVAVNSLQALIALAKQKPLSYASAGIGTTPHLTGELLFKTLARVDITHVPYSGGGPAVIAVVGAQTPVGITAIPTVLPMIKNGRLHAIAVTSQPRAPALPEVLTVAEQGFPGYSDYTWIAFLAPAATPREIVAKVNADIARVLQTPDARERLAGIGFDPMANSPRVFSDYLKSEVVKWAKVVRDSGARAD
jgi:tripartite-type tricarboxylate transporter receptor subunit TctC